MRSRTVIDLALAALVAEDLATCIAANDDPARAAARVAAAAELGQQREQPVSPQSEHGRSPVEAHPAVCQ